MEESQDRRYWRRHVQMMPADMAGDTRRHQPVNQFAGADAPANVSGRRIWRRRLDRKDPRRSQGLEIGDQGSTSAGTRRARA